MHKFTPFLIVAVVLAGAGVFVGMRGQIDPALASADIAGAEVAQPAARPVRPPAATFTPVFEPCAHCHQIGDGARVVVGPVLNGIVGRPAAITDSPYSEAMQNSGVVWDEPTLKAFLTKPEAVVPGTRMYFDGLPESDIDAIIEFLENPETEGSDTER